VLLSTNGLSLCLFLGACLWVTAVQTNILVSYAATESISVAFYVVDWISACMLASLFFAGVSATAKRAAKK